MSVQTYAGLTEQQKTFYDKTLLKRLLPKLVFMQHGQKKPVKKREGDTANYRRFNRLTAATTPLVEGVTPVGSELNISEVTATIQGYGDYVVLSDFIDMVGIDPVITETTEVLGEQAAETLDMVVRDVVAAGTNVYRVGGRANRNEVTATDTLDGATMRRVRQVMARNNVKPVAKVGAYLAFPHPDCSYDIQGDSAWTNANQYAGATRIFEGELGKMYNVRYIETTMAPIWTEEGAASIDVYGTLVIGRDAYGVPDVGGSSKPQTIIKPLGSAGVSDPLNQRSSVGWKAYLATVRLDELCILRVESAASVGEL